MKAIELRIGNKVELYGSIATVERFDFNTDAPKGLAIDHGKPIPLTEEWLRKLHTEEEIEKSVRFPNEITIYDRFLFIWKPEYKYWYVVTSNHKEYLTKIEFVHEYQNFIFSLTGEELNG